MSIAVCPTSSEDIDISALFVYYVDEAASSMSLHQDYNTTLKKNQGGNMTNIEIKSHALTRGVKLWQIAEKLRISEATMTRMLRKELPQAKQQEIMTIIDQISEAKHHE